MYNNIAFALTHIHYIHSFTRTPYIHDLYLHHRFPVWAGCRIAGDGADGPYGSCVVAWS